MIRGRLPYQLLLWTILVPGMAIGQIKFSDITSEAGINHHYLGVTIMGAGAAFFDLDNDGDEDLWITGGLISEALYEHDGTGRFTNISPGARLEFAERVVTTGVITGDIDNDGFRDVLLLTHVGFPNILLRNNGNRTFTQVTGSSVIQDHEAYNLAAAMGDVNLDGYLDIYTADYIEKDNVVYNDTRDSVLGFQHQCHTNRLYLNPGPGTNGSFDWKFSEVAEQWGVADRGCALATTFSDYDNDNDPDLLVANDFGAWVVPNALFENRYTGRTFEDVSKYSGMNVGIYGMGIATGDYDNDLDLDYYITNIGENVLLQNNGDGTFINMTYEAGVEDVLVTEELFTTGWGTAFMDLDNDTDLDLYVVNGYVPAARFIANARANPNRLFENDGSGNFTLLESITSSPLRGRGIAYADIDNDGDLDFLVTNVNRQATSDSIQKVQLFRNDTDNGNRWLDIKLEGTESNRDGFGSKILLTAGGKKFLQEAGGGFGTHASQSSSTIHFGLGQLESIDSLLVIWPGGAEQLLTDLATNQLISIKEESTVTGSRKSLVTNFHNLKCFPNPFDEKVHIRFQLNNGSSGMVDIFDTTGRLILERFIAGKSGKKHNFTWIPPYRGTFFVRLQSNHQFSYNTIVSN